MMTRTYKSHDVTSTGWLNPETNQWKPTVLIVSHPTATEHHHEERYFIDIPFTDDRQAESAGLEYARRLIDRRD